MKYLAMRKKFNAGITEQDANDLIESLSVSAVAAVYRTALRVSVKSPGNKEEYYIGLGVAEFLGVKFRRG
jgi:hypothetical protein